ncbi:CHRD domain-containing protein [Nocardioides donggukensis]|uniref:CHRD domain-containing protein n=1 Tax=Nocardioides donggukensis TaxID=2774019 RepID=A0A927K3P4_9ACTN|nr:CHRD domain-containing protein [Nocardioides donggukensis]MBD8869569.1 CHRD domain-containing protein [Nocardioides donggukensis]
MSLPRNLVYAVAGASTALLALPLLPANAGHTNSVLEADLNGRAEVGPDKRIAGDPNGRGEAYVFGIDNDPNTLCYVLTVDKIGTAVAAHIHEGPAGSNGPVVVNLAAPADGNAADCLTEGEEGKFVGDQTVAEILANPADYYVNVHNAEYPGGAVRGQLAPQR